MTTKIKTTLLTVFFIFGLLTGLQAQDKYEYAIVSYYPNIPSVTVSENGEVYQETKIAKADLKGLLDLNPILRKVNEMTDKGWEVFSTDKSDATYFFYLRKKKN